MRNQPNAPTIITIPAPPPAPAPAPAPQIIDRGASQIVPYPVMIPAPTQPVIAHGAVGGGGGGNVRNNGGGGSEAGALMGSFARALSGGYGPTGYSDPHYGHDHSHDSGGLFGDSSTTFLALLGIGGLLIFRQMERVRQELEPRGFASSSPSILTSWEELFRRTKINATAISQGTKTN